MQLRSIVLENIRSYSSQRIDFFPGSLLLAGDIGSGKSTILLAIEFALFGLKTGELTGSALLRHGSKKGFVELSFHCAGKEVTIRRTLSRGKERIGQSSGSLVIDKVKEDLMPKELKAKIFEVLHYPESLVAKSQDLLYRFTVYTPQEQMKSIIYEDKDARLDTLRKVFDIDRYKRIRENSLLYSRELKGRIKHLQGKLEDFEQKKSRLQDFLHQLEEKKEEESKTSASFKAAQEKTAQAKKELEAVEGKSKEINEIKKKLEVLDAELKGVVEKRVSNQKECEKLSTSVAQARQILKDFKEDPSLTQTIQEKQAKLIDVEQALSNSTEKKSEIKGKVNHLKEDSEKIKNLDNCPLCLQQVPHDHKKGIITKANDEIRILKESFDSNEEQEKNFQKQKVMLQQEIQTLQKKSSQQELNKLKKESLLKEEQQLQELKKDDSKQKIADINTRKIELSKKIDKDIEKKYAEAKELFQKMQAEERKVELQQTTLSTEIDGMQKQLDLLKAEVVEKESDKKNLEKTQKLNDWLSSTFVGLVNSIEKHVMLSVYHEFNELFRKWFDMLIEDEQLSVRLDDSFSVIVEQNGYEGVIDNLSGGEKTSVALAYRLALNQVINDVVSQIQTKDVLILDEPTEGFSTDQLDKVRDVLEQLNIAQIIIVSHENKIESYVDNVIRVEKTDGLSAVS
ncbi:SMC family ATPase [Candidatus Woesearchaeota archaeon]|nr:SMC family ATPase [Candidatus Woesearchaeota archaeon]